MSSQAKGQKKKRTPGECTVQAGRSNRNKINQARARARNRRLEQHPKQVKPLATNADTRMRYINDLPEDF